MMVADGSWRKCAMRAEFKRIGAIRFVVNVAVSRSSSTVRPTSSSLWMRRCG